MRAVAAGVFSIAVGALLLVLIAREIPTRVPEIHHRVGDPDEWVHCSLGGDSSPASPCVRPHLVAAHKGRRIPSDGALDVQLPHAFLSGDPVALDIEVFTYEAAPAQLVTRLMLRDLVPTLRRVRERGGLGRALAVTDTLRQIPQRPRLGLMGAPETITLDLPPELAGHRAAYAVWSWPSRATTHDLEVSATNGATLHLAAGVRDVALALGAPPVTMRAELGDDDGEELLEVWETTIDPASTGAAAGGWHRGRIDLTPWAGQELTLTLTTEGVPEVTYGIWARPHVSTPTSPPTPPTSVVLLSLDTLRADHVGAYGYARATTPALDRLAARSAVFLNAFAPFPSTTASHMSMLTGRLPCDHRVTAPGERLAAGIRTVAEQFAAAGYRTAAITENGLIKGDAGFHRGFDDYRDIEAIAALGSFDDVIDRAERWLERTGTAPFFLFLHTYQVHSPYKFPPRLARAFAPAADTETDRQRADYDRGLRFADDYVGELLRLIARTRRHRPVALVVTSDHGTEFGERGRIGHALGVHVEQLHVPLMIQQPDVVSPQRITELAELTDLPRTMLALASIPAPADLGGVDLLAPRDPDTPRLRPIFGDQLWGPRHTSLRTPTFTWIHGPDGTKVFLAEDDPRETIDVSRDRPELARHGRTAIEEFWRVCSPDENAGRRQPLQVDPDRAEALKALGYIE